MNFRAMVFVMAAMAAFANGQVATTPGSPQYPLAMKTRWTYQMRQEFAPGARPSGPDAAFVKGNVLETTVVSEVAGSDMIGGIKYIRIESRHDGRLWMTEWMRLAPEGLFLGKTNEDGDETILVPPQKILSSRMAAGETWAWKAARAPVNIQTKVTGKETTEVPAGKFEAIKTIHELSMVLPQATIRSTNSRWFLPGLGYVRQDTEIYAGDRFVSRVHLRLVTFDAAK